MKLEPLKDETEKKANSYIADRYSDKKICASGNGKKTYLIRLQRV